MDKVRTANKLSLAYSGEIIATCRDGWHWFSGGFKDFFSKNLLVALGIIIVGWVINLFLGFIPLGSELVLSASVSLIYMWLALNHYHGVCSFSELMNEFTSKIMPMVLYALTIWVLNFVLYILGFVLIVLIFGAEIWSFAKWFWEYYQTHDVFSAIMAQDIHALVQMFEELVRTGADYILSHPWIILHALIFYTIYIFLDLIAFMCKFFALPLTLYGEVNPVQALWISFKTCTKNWLSLTVAYTMYWLFKLIVWSPILGIAFLLGCFPSSWGSVSVFVVTALTVQSLGLFLLSFAYKILSCMEYFITFRACRTIFWGKYDQLRDEMLGK